MNIVVSGIHLSEFPEMEGYAREKVAKLFKFQSRIGKINVRLISKKSHREKRQDYYCELEIDLPGRNLTIVDVEESMDKAIDMACERMKRTLIKYKEKKISKQHKLGFLAKLRSRFPF